MQGGRRRSTRPARRRCRIAAAGVADCCMPAANVTMALHVIECAHQPPWQDTANEACPREREGGKLGAHRRRQRCTAHSMVGPVGGHGDRHLRGAFVGFDHQKSFDRRTLGTDWAEADLSPAKMALSRAPSQSLGISSYALEVKMLGARWEHSSRLWGVPYPACSTSRGPAPRPQCSQSIVEPEFTRGGQAGLPHPAAAAALAQRQRPAAA